MPSEPARPLLRPWLLDLAALLAGACYVLAFAPFELRPLGVLAPAAFFLLLRRAAPRRALWRGWLFGLGQFGAGVSWLYYSFHLFGDAIAPVAGLLTVGFVVFMALYPALLGYGLARWVDLSSATGLVVAAPAAWWLAEWVRGWLLGGFPWLLAGYTQIDGPLAGFAPVFGVYGISWLVALTAGLVATALARQWRWSLALPVVLLWPLGGLLGTLEWTEPVGQPVRAALVQGNIPQDRKFRSEMLLRSLDSYQSMSRELDAVDLVVWPETAVPTFHRQAAPILEEFVHEMRGRGVDVATGVFLLDEQRRYYNSVIKLGDPSAVYRKRHLVPFGEYLPLRDWLVVLEQWISIPMSDISAGPPGQAPLVLAGHPVSVSVCYEDAFGSLSLPATRQAHMLLNVSNDSWFGDSSAPHQHLEIARMRALEARRPMLRATNTGVSAIIDHRGRVVNRVAQFERGTAIAEIRAMRGDTPFLLAGNWPVGIGAGLALVVGLARGRRARVFAGRSPQRVE